MSSSLSYSEKKGKEGGRERDLYNIAPQSIFYVGLQPQQERSIEKGTYE